MGAETIAEFAVGLSEDDVSTLRAWLSTFGDEADGDEVKARVKLLLSLRAEHPTRPSLDAMLDEPMARAVLNASIEGRPGVMKRYRRWCARARRARSRDR
ncbi:MAG: hypothetical protein U0326_21325 [Polyangiales bacterium]